MDFLVFEEAIVFTGLLAFLEVSGPCLLLEGRVEEQLQVVVDA